MFKGRAGTTQNQTSTETRRYTNIREERKITEPQQIVQEDKKRLL
jgi:hypothetical protein